MSFPIKSHLPLITTRVEFKFNKLPPPPQITTRRDFGAHVRRRARHNSVPYSRPRTRGQTPGRERSIGLGFESDSSLSDLSDTDASLDGDNDQSISPLIPKPAGEAGKVNSWTKRRYQDFERHIKTEVADKLNVAMCFSRQKPADLDEIIQSGSSKQSIKHRYSTYLCVQTAQKFGIENTYKNNWPIREALKARLKYTADWEKKKVERRINAELKEVLKQLKGKRKASVEKETA
ncbi:hypothetical protein M413DRAFT_32736 [Hebeloma cylindrosporum]|uniref:Uncharacterized protein n=1 Tax=Hebeloma cylindrosporum TaxID=76867 RepID=A0A0C3BEC5_HEBCY|nr:hypothetical protein M413DRAFT_32736 [Hebeloma cylindrosporum h7]